MERVVRSGVYDEEAKEALPFNVLLSRLDAPSSYIVHELRLCTNTLLKSEWAMFRGDVRHIARSVQRGIQRPVLAADGTLEMTFAVETGRTYAVEYSTNLVNWFQLTNFVNTTSTIQSIDTKTANSGHGFYRLGTQVP